MVGMFFSDGVLVAGVAVGRRGPFFFCFFFFSFSYYIYIHILISFMFLMY